MCLNWFGSGEHYWGIVILLTLHNLNLTLCFSWGGCWFLFFVFFIVSSRLVLCISLKISLEVGHLNVVKNMTSTFNIGYVKRQIFSSVIISCFE